MAKSLVPSDFRPTMETVKALMAWGVEQKNPCGDKLIDQEFIERKSIIYEFIDYWLNVAPVKDRKKSNWQTTYRNYIKLIAWPKNLRDFEYNRHRRTEYGNGGLNPINTMVGRDKTNVAVKPKYRPPTAEESIAKFNELEKRINNG